MTDTPGSGPTPDDFDKVDTAAEEAAHRARMAELFEDIDGEAPVETPELVKAERDNLRTQVLALSNALDKSQQANTAQKEESSRAAARIKQQFEEQKPFMLEKFVREVLPVIDNLELGLKSVSPEVRAADPKFDKHMQGIEKTLNQLTSVFNKFGVRTINPLGEEFDPNKHEALGMKDGSPEADSETVVEVAQKGYELNGRIIRPARVFIKP